MTKYIGAIDQGTTSTRFILFDDLGRIVSVAQKEHEQIYLQPGWVEHNPEEIWQRTVEVISQALQQAGISGTELAGIGITNQRIMLSKAVSRSPARWCNGWGIIWA
jgi:glycerol kinase